jgi:hypothetical protein
MGEEERRRQAGAYPAEGGDPGPEDRGRVDNYFVCEVDAHERAHVIAGPMTKAMAEKLVTANDAKPDGPTTFALDAAGLMVLQAADGDITSILGPKVNDPDRDFGRGYPRLNG